MKYFLAAFIQLLFISTIFSQADSTQIKVDTSGISNKIEEESKPFLGFLKEPGNEPKKAVFYSVICPGGGQFYNKQYWKVPLAFGGVAAAGYFVYSNTNQYRRYRDAYRIRVDGDPLTLDEFYDNPNATEEALVEIRDNYRKWMEQSYLAVVVVYGLNVLEAYTAAHLKNFDIDEDLSLQWQPKINLQQSVLFDNPNMEFGISMKLVNKTPDVILDF